MLIIGSHVSYTATLGLVGSVNESLENGGNSFMFYTGAPQNTIRSSIDIAITNKAKEMMRENGIDIENVIIHAPYIINLANNREEDKYNFSIRFLKEELKRAEILGINKVVLHPGNHVGLGLEVGIKSIIHALNIVLDSENGPIICLETMAGKGTEIGQTFEELKEIIDGVKFNNRLMVCLDTCHTHDAGYDLNDFDLILKEFEDVIGIDKLGCIHVNDSKNEYAAHKDRHENIGMGKIGFDNLIKIIYNDKLKEIPKILETPYVSSGTSSYSPYKSEIAMIKSKKFNSNLIEEIINHHK